MYKVTHTSGGSSKSKKGAGGKAQPVLEPVLEEQPKWLLLREVVEEIQAQRGVIASIDPSTAEAGPPARSGDKVCCCCTPLILCSLAGSIMNVTAHAGASQHTSGGKQCHSEVQP